MWVSRDTKLRSAVFTQVAFNLLPMLENHLMDRRLSLLAFTEHPLPSQLFLIAKAIMCGPS
jgi:hypothetical protein